MSGRSADALGTEETLVVELARALEPLEEAARVGPDEVAAFLVRATGERSFRDDELEDVRAIVVDDLAEPLATLRDLVLEPVRSGDDLRLGPRDVAAVTGAVGEVYAGLQRLRGVEFEAIDGTEVAERVLAHLLVTYLRRHHRSLHAGLCLIGVVEEGAPPVLDLSKLPRFLREPSRLPAEAFGWGTDSFTAFLVLYYLHELCWRFQIPATLTEPAADEDDALADVADASDEVVEELTVPIVSLVEERATSAVGVRVVPLPGRSETEIPGLAIVPFGVAGGGQSYDLGEGWTFNIESSVEASDWALGVRPGPETSAPKSEVLGPEDPPGELELAASMAYGGGGTPPIERPLLGDPDGSRIGLRYVELDASIRYEDGEAVFRVSLPARGTLAVDPEDLDDFLAAVLPSRGLVYDVDVTVGWSSERGLFFERGDGLEVSLPQQGRVGPVRVTETYLSVLPDADEDAVRVEGSASADVELGPVTGTITRFGVKADVGFPEDADGSAGPIDLDVGVKPPDGIAVSVDAEVVTGGGFLRYDPEAGRYAGAVQLSVGDLTLNAVGLLTTRLPGGSGGYSLLLLVAGEFTPVRLGLGFTLNGVGGLLGVHRTVDASALADAVRSQSLDSVLFPSEPAENAARVVSDLGELFPPKHGDHVFGPMAKLAWGTPPLATGDVGVVVRLPSKDMFLLGRMTAALPPEGDRTVVDLNVDLAGQVSPDEQRAAFDASLDDSRVGPWTVTGDVAVRSRWGDRPWFLLSVGGYNPRYDPPTAVPELEPITVTGGLPTGLPSLELSGYVAVTPNTVQIGADVLVEASAGPATVEGEIGFDALFQFDPFKFVVDFAAAVAIEIHGKGVSATLDGTLSGPAPWHVRGSAHVDLFFFDASVSVDVTFGEAARRAPLPSTRVMPELVAAFENPDNWTAQQPATGESVASLREVEADGEVLAHPLGRLGVRQTVVPLNFDLDWVGTARPGDFTRFSIDEVAVEEPDGEPSPADLGRPLREHFAPAQYEELSSAEKLDEPGFVRLEAGREAAPGGPYYGGETSEDLEANTRTTTLTYETSVVDERRGVHAEALADLGGFSQEDAVVSIPPEIADALAGVSAVARADTRTTGTARFRTVEETPAPADAGAERSGAERAPDATPTRRAEEGTPADAGDGASIEGNRLTGPVVVDEARYAVVRGDDLAPTDVGATDDSPALRSRPEARQALERHLEQHPEDEGRLRLVGASAVREMRRARSDDGSGDSLQAGDLEGGALP